MVCPGTGRGLMVVVGDTIELVFSEEVESHERLGEGWVWWARRQRHEWCEAELERLDLLCEGVVASGGCHDVDEVRW